MSLIKVLFHGNCQSLSLAKLFSQFEGFEVLATPLLWDIKDIDVLNIRDFVASADLVIAMPISPAYKDGLGTLELRELSTCPFIIHPNAHFEGFYPSFDYVRDDQGRHLDLNSFGNPHWDYLCHLTYSCFDSQMTECESVRLLSCQSADSIVNDMYSESLKNLISREQKMIQDHSSYPNSTLVAISNILSKSARMLGLL